ncbi:multidrug effflux MFS transporter [Massilia sp. YIM B02763]|uniref:multidrug effflux MFS transporter n=1 Tax=Massilia sp. YIM B02763 TaxID=3050130 RepID=UPI0025B6C24F|nr:multidrug effflux MFS transporter [Massilia sp. YIM B02763]MDN4051768.1 multidrug effflux MFS transporter [Massilia sp. YIM B02763]
MQRLLTAILACLSMVGPLAIDTYLPSIPAIGQEFGVGAVAVQQTLSVFLFTFAFMMLFYGTLSDSFGRRPVILVALAVYVGASAGAVLAPSFGWLLVCRALQGLSAGAGSVVGQAIVQDRFNGADAQRVMSHILMVFGLAPAIAPVLGGWLHVTFGWRATFVFLSLFALLMMLVVWKLLPESLPREKRHAFHGMAILANYGKVLRHPQFLLLSLSVGLAFAGIAIYIGAAANFVMEILGLPETAFGWMFFPLVGGMVAGSAWGGKRATKVPPARLRRIGYGLMALACVANLGYAAAVSDRVAVPWAVLPLMVFTFGLTVAMPAIQVTALGLFPHNRGLASSLLSFIQMMSFALVSGLVTPLLFGSATRLAAGLAVMVAASFVASLLAGAVERKVDGSATAA